ncbi:MAG: hypothetical protein V6Z81_09280 [Parvularculales bacterium]
MRSLTTLSFAIAMAFAFSAPAVFTPAPAYAGDWLDTCVGDVCYDSDGNTRERGSSWLLESGSPAH